MQNRSGFVRRQFYLAKINSYVKSKIAKRENKNL